MTVLPPDNLENLLREHLSKTLDGERGRAAAAFRKHVEAEHGQAEPFNRLVIPRRALWYWAGVPSLMAACLAVVVTLQFMGGPKKIDTPITPNPGNIAFEKLDQYELSHDINDGVAVLDDNTPIRVIRRQTLRHTQWVDPNDKATYSVTEPVEKVGYITVQPY
jgi:hypothetical protein